MVEEGGRGDWPSALSEHPAHFRSGITLVLWFAHIALHGCISLGRYLLSYTPDLYMSGLCFLLFPSVLSRWVAHEGPRRGKKDPAGTGGRGALSHLVPRTPPALAKTIFGLTFSFSAQDTLLLNCRCLWVLSPSRSTQSFYFLFCVNYFGLLRTGSRAPRQPRPGASCVPVSKTLTKTARGGRVVGLGALGRVPDRPSVHPHTPVPFPIPRGHRKQIGWFLPLSTLYCADGQWWDI